jgi:PAS domain S-box-containing protein
MDLTTQPGENNSSQPSTLFTQGGKMGQLMESYDWNNHPLGDPKHWPKSLQTGVRMMLLSGYPMFIWWSDELYMLYNDAYAPTFVGKHQVALGAKARNVWADIWEQLGGIIEEVFSKGTTFYAQDMLVIPQRKGFKEETYWTFSYSPMPDDNGKSNGIFCACSDVTEKVLSERRIKTLHELSQLNNSLETVEQVCQYALQILGQKEADLPFTAIYLLDQRTQKAYLKGQTHPQRSFPSSLELPFSVYQAHVPLEEKVNSLETLLKKHIGQHTHLFHPGHNVGHPSSSHRDEFLNKAILLPLTGQNGLLGFFVAGISPMLEYTPSYGQFHQLLSGQLTSLIEAVAVREKERQQIKALEIERNWLYSLFEQAPVAFTILDGEDYLVGLANPSVLQIWGRTKEQVLHKPLFEALPEIRNQGLEALLDGVRLSGKPHIGKELAVEFERQGKRERVYFNFIYQPIWGQKGNIISIAVIATDVSELVISREKVEAKALQLQDTNRELYQSRQALEQINTELEERITLRTKQIHLAQQQAEKQRNQIFELFMQAPAGIALLEGPDHVYQMANQMYYQVLGRSSQILGKPGREAFPEGVEQGIWDLLDRVYASGEPYVGKDFRAFIDMEGRGELTEQYFDFVFQPVREDVKQVRGILITVLNVTHQVLARKAILERETYFREMAENLPGMIWMTRPDGTCSYLNKPWYEYTGQSEQEALGLGWLSAIHPEDFSTSKEIFLSANAVHRSFSLLYRLRQKDGNYRWFLDKGEPRYDREGTFEGFVGTVIDVHEQQLAQQRLHLSVKAGKVGLWEWDVVNDRATYSPLLQEMFGFQADSLKENFEGAYGVYQQVIHPEDRQLVNERVEKAFADKETEFYVEFRIVKPRGEIAWIAERGQVIFEGEQAVRMNGTCIDVTSRKNQEEASQRLSDELAATNEELRAANEEIQAANEELGESNQELSRINADLDNFVYTASHDLKAPILNVEGLLKVLERQLDSQTRQSQPVEQIYELLYTSVARFKSTIADLTEVARINKESAEDIATIALEEVLEEVQQDLRPQIREAEAKIKINLNCPQIRFSRKNLKSILYNLLSNAIKYRSPEREALIQITCLSEANYQVLSVQDNGLGMDMRQEDKIFALFKRLHTHVEGTGIGLYIVKRIIENAAGKIEVESREGVGSTFRVYFKA